MQSDNFDRKKFSLVSAVYNVSPYLDKFIGSLESQTINLGMLEIIVVNDGSTDDSLIKLQEWAHQRPELVTVLEKKNGGQASARNLGLKIATGEWVTFIDPDDWVNKEYFENVCNFIEMHDSNLEMVATNRVLFEEDKGALRDGHPLRKMFTSDQLVGLNRFPNYFHGSAPSAFMKLDVINSSCLCFDERVWPNFEDGHFCSHYLLNFNAPKIGFLKSSIYYYRKRSDKSSTLNSSVQKTERFTHVPKYGYLNLLKVANKKYKNVPIWLQNIILYELSWYFSEEDKPSGAETVATGETGLKFIDTLGEIAKYLDESVIRGFNIRRYKQVWRDILRQSSCSNKRWHTNFVVIKSFDERLKEIKIAFRFIGEKPNVKYLVKGLPINPKYSKIREYRYFGSPLLLEQVVWIPGNGTVRVLIEDKPVELRTSWVDDFAQISYPPKSLNALTSSKEKKNINVLIFPGYLVRTVLNFMNKYLKFKAIRDVAGSLENNIISFIANVYPFNSKFHNAWVFIDRIHNSNDSAEILFNHTRKEHPNINAWFVLKADTPDWYRLVASRCDRLVAHGSLEWKLLMINCEKLISSHMDVPIHRPPEILKLRAPNWKFICLQHGVIKDDLSLWLNTKKIDLFITSTPAEYESIAGSQTPYVMTKKEVVLTGLPRFDALYEASVRAANKPKKHIIFAPTWRHWLLNPLKAGVQIREKNESFEDSDFVKIWGEVLSLTEFKDPDLLKKYTISILPHPNLDGMLHSLNVGEHFQILNYERSDFRDILATAEVLITDYSSVAFNAAYLGTPVIYFQFDRQKVLGGGHVGRQGYFDYYKDGFGPVVESTKELSYYFNKIVNQKVTDQIYIERMNNTFPNKDGKCCERVVEAIKGLG